MPVSEGAGFLSESISLMKGRKTVKIAIIGGYGKMGRWLARFLTNEGMQVVISGRDQKKLAQAASELGVEAATNTDAVSGANAVILSVPINGFESVVREISPYTRSGQMIFDIASVKAMPVEVMHRYIKKATLLGTHPMFGPGASGFTGKNVALTPVNGAEEKLAGKVQQFLKGKKARVIIMTPEEHDRVMSIVLGLSHFIGLVAADTLSGLKDLKKTLQSGGTTYRMLLTLAESVVSEGPDFYASLQMNLPDMDKIYELLLERAEYWALSVNPEAGRPSRLSQ